MPKAHFGGQGGAAVMKTVVWNVNGLRRKRKSFCCIPAKSKADIFCCQEIKIRCPLSAPGRLWFWNPPNARGTRAHLTLARREPSPMRYGMGIGPFDDEGRLILLEYNVATFCF